MLQLVRLCLLPACFQGEDYLLGMYSADLGIDTQVNLSYAAKCNHVTSSLCTVLLKLFLLTES